MNEEFFYEILSPIIVFCLLFFAVAEFIGRSKHIGRWWTFFLMFAFIPGIIALIFSPSAKEKPTKGSSVHTIFGVIFLILGVISFFGKIEEYQITDFFAHVGEIATGFYLIYFAKGKITNQNPKFYFQNQQYKQTTNFKSSTNTIKNNFLYFIVENGKQSENPLTFEELKEKKISENTFVWRNGLEAWLPAKELEELHSIIVFNPPPFIFDKFENQLIQTPPPFNL